MYTHNLSSQRLVACLAQIIASLIRGQRLWISTKHLHAGRVRIQSGLLVLSRAPRSELPMRTAQRPPRPACHRHVRVRACDGSTSRGGVPGGSPADTPLAPTPATPAAQEGPAPARTEKSKATPPMTARAGVVDSSHAHVLQERPNADLPCLDTPSTLNRALPRACDVKRGPRNGTPTPG